MTLGDYETKTSTDTLVEKNNSSNTNDLAALRGARLVSAIETSAGKRLAEALVKELTGQDAVTARFLYQEFFTFLPVFKLWLACNHVPVIQGQDFAIWRRIRLIPFNVQFQDADHPTGPYKDKALSDKLKSEHEGILAWLVRGCLDWQKDGLSTAKAVRAATGKLQQDMDVLGGFLGECCVFERNAQSTAKELYAAYCDWAARNGEKPLSQRWFGLRLSERGSCESFKTQFGKSWHGIGLLSGRSETSDESDSMNHKHLMALSPRKSHGDDIESYGTLREDGSYGAENNTREESVADDALDSLFGVDNASDSDSLAPGNKESATAIPSNDEKEDYAQCLRKWGQSHDYPRLEFLPGHAIAEGITAWTVFTTRAVTDHQRAAMQAAIALDNKEGNGL